MVVKSECALVAKPGRSTAMTRMKAYLRATLAQKMKWWMAVQ
jgi:hypothetical protein